MAQRVKLIVLLAVASLVLAVLLVGGRAETPTLARAQYPVSPVTINGQDAGSLPAIKLSTQALPHCDAGESYVPADGGAMRCGVASGGSGAVQYATDGGGLTIVEGGVQLYPACDAGFLAHPAGQPWQCVPIPLPPAAIGQDDASTNQALVWNGSHWGPSTIVDGVSSVTGAGSTSCSPTTGAVTCTTPTSLPPNGTAGGSLTGTYPNPGLATVPVSAGGTGASPTCVGGDLVMASSSTVMACVASSGDVSYASGGAATVTSLQAGEITVGGSTATLTAASGATAPGLAQASTSGATPATMQFAPQLSTNAAGNGSLEEHLIQAATGGGAEGAWCIDHGAFGTHDLCVSRAGGGSTTTYLNMGANSGIPSTSAGGWILRSNYSSGFVSLAGNGGFELFTSPSAIEVYADPTSHFVAENSLYIGPDPAVYGGGTHVLGIANGTAPTSACTGGTCVDSVSAVGLVATSAAFDIDGLQPVSSGTRASQITHSVKYRCVGSSTTSVSVVCSKAVPQGPGCSVDIDARVVCTNSLGACNGAGANAFTEQRTVGASVKNPSGTASLLSGTPLTTTTGDPTTGLSCVPTTSGANIVLTCGDLTVSSTADWTIDLDMNCE